MFGAPRIIASSLLALLLGVSATYDAFAQVKKVPTERIIVPEEKSDSSEGGVESSQIPSDALPSLELKKDKDGEDKPDDGAADANQNDDAPPPPILRDVSKLPEPVRQMRARILEIAKKGDIEALRPLFSAGEETTTLSIGGLEGDPIKFMKETSGDDDGFEILAILIEVLEAGFVHLDNETDEEVYVWPYFFSHELDKLTPEQRIELFRILTAGDVQDSENFGSYVFYRAGIKPDGSWAFFVAGD